MCVAASAACPARSVSDGDPKRALALYVFRCRPEWDDAEAAQLAQPPRALPNAHPLLSPSRGSEHRRRDEERDVVLIA